MERLVGSICIQNCRRKSGLKAVSISFVFSNLKIIFQIPVMRARAMRIGRVRTTILESTPALVLMTMSRVASRDRAPARALALERGKTAMWTQILTLLRACATKAFNRTVSCLITVKASMSRELILAFNLQSKLGISWGQMLAFTVREIKFN